MASLPSGPLAQRVGFVLCRVIVPLWILTGAAFKLVEHTPRLLPKNILDVFVRTLGVPEYPLLATLISLELLAIAVMLFVGRLARAMAIFMLASFVLILIAEIVAGNTSCGCLGSKSPNIWLMLGIDASLLLLTILYRPGRGPTGLPTPRWPVPAAAGFTLIGAVLTFAIVIQAGRPIVPQETPGGGGSGTTELPGHIRPAANPCDYEKGTVTNPSVASLPGSWITPNDVGQWAGLRWCEVPIFQFMKTWPRDLDAPKKFVIFYSRTCDHCEEMFVFDFATDPELARKVTAVEVPASKKLMTDPGGWAMPETECELLQLPLGCDYIMTTPLVFAIENGVITCAKEGDHVECMDVYSE